MLGKAESSVMFYGLPFDIIVVKAFYNVLAKKREDIYFFSILLESCCVY